MEDYNKLLHGDGRGDIPHDTLILIIKKLQQNSNRLQCLKLEQLAITVTSGQFRQEFMKQTGLDWMTKFEPKALQRLQDSQFDMHWMLSKYQDKNAGLFASCIQGDVGQVQEFAQREHPDLLKIAVDINKRSPLHIAAKQGHTTLLQYLLRSGCNPNSRDQLLLTPLHLACQQGHQSVCSALIRADADPSAVDTAGRTPLHYACCGTSSEIITLLVGMKPEIVDVGDYSLLNPLHYAIFNSTSKQIDIVRKLIQFKANINCREKDGQTPLFLAAEGGQSRVIPILVQKGADLTMTDYHNNKTPLEVASNDRVRQLLIVYKQSSNPTSQTIAGTSQTQDIAWMNNAIKGERKVNPVLENKWVDPKQLGQKSSLHLQLGLDGFSDPDQKGQQGGAPGTENQKQPGKSPSAVMDWVRERFFQLMRKIQDQGVKRKQHVRKPFIYTASWMEGVQNMEDLFNYISSLTATESCLCTFNVLCPYDQPLPFQDENLQVIDKINTEDPWHFEKQQSAAIQKKLHKDKQVLDLQELVDEYQIQIDFKDKVIKEKLEEIKALQLDQMRLETEIDELNTQSTNPLSDLKQNLEKQTLQLEQLKKDLLKEKQVVREKDQRIESLQLQLKELTGTDDQQQLINADQFVRIKEQLRVARQREKMSRLRAGNLFLKVLNNKGASSQQSTNVPSNQQNLADDDALIRMMKALQNNPPSYAQRLSKVDQDQDNKVTQSEFNNYCSQLGLTPQDMISLSRIFGFQDGRKLLSIKEFDEICRERPQQRILWEKKLFQKLLDSMKKKNLDIDQFFSLIDEDQSGELSVEELRAGIQGLKIVLNQRDLNNLFCIFDKDQNNSVSLTEMKQTLENYLLEVEGDPNELAEGQNVLEIINYDAVFRNENQLYDTDNFEINSIKTPISGFLKIQLKEAEIFTTNILKKIFLQIELSGLAEDQIFTDLIPSGNTWQKALQIPITNTQAVNLGNYLTIQIHSQNSFNDSSYLGEIAMSWKTCIKNEGNWAIDQDFTLVNFSYPHISPKGYVSVVMQYMNEESSKEDGKQQSQQVSFDISEEAQQKGDQAIGQQPLSQSGQINSILSNKSSSPQRWREQSKIQDLNLDQVNSNVDDVLSNVDRTMNADLIKRMNSNPSIDQEQFRLVENYLDKQQKSQYNQHESMNSDIEGFLNQSDMKFDNIKNMNSNLDISVDLSMSDYKKLRNNNKKQ